MLGQPGDARRYAQLSLEATKSGDVPPFYVAYAYEALARAEAASGHQAKMAEYLGRARRAVADVTDQDAAQQLLDDLDSIA
jgi:hypothetical protein